MNKLHGYYTSGKFAQFKKEKLPKDDALSSADVLAVKNAGKVLFVATAEGLYLLDTEALVSERLFASVLDGRIADVEILPGDVTAVAQGRIVYAVKGKKIKALREFDSDIIGFEYDNGSFWVLTENRLYCTDEECSKDTVNRCLEGGTGKCLAAGCGKIYCVTDTYISSIHGKRREWRTILPEFSGMPRETIHCMHFDATGYLWLGTDSGTYIYDTNSLWLSPDKLRVLPKNAVYAMAEDDNGGRYFASDVGVIYQDKGYHKYFNGDRFTEDSKVTAVAVSGDGGMIFAGTHKGLSFIRRYETTLAEKAAQFDEIMEKYHIRHGFTATRRVYDYNMDSGKVDISDNDGLWTASYVAAESFRYAATGDKDALEKARRGMNALLLLESVSGIPGFTARAVRYPGEEGFDDGNHEWVKTPDGECEWKCETSSDEITGHFFGMSLYYDLCADEGEKVAISKSLCAITDHIITHGYRLVDHDNLPTTWAVWDPDMLNLDDKWFAERGVNSLEFLTILRVSHHISGDEKYKQLFDKFVVQYHYPMNVMQHKIQDAHQCHIDDNLCFLAAYTLLRLEENETVRAFVFNGLEDHWNYERVERQPMFSIMHSVLTGRDTDLSEGIQSLREMPLDLVHYKVKNSDRKDLIWDDEQEKLCAAPQVKYPLPYDERNLHRPDAGAFHLDTVNTSGLTYVMEGTIYLLPYWMGRYYGIIREEE